jgi:hypothetical protein
MDGPYGGYRTVSQPSLQTFAGNTLLSQRESLVRDRFTRSSTHLAPVPESERQFQRDDSRSVSESHYSAAADDDVRHQHHHYNLNHAALPHRRSSADMLQRQPSNIPQRYSQLLQLQPQQQLQQQQQQPPQQQPAVPHRPKRHSDIDPRRRDAMMAQWRQSLREHAIPNQQQQQQQSPLAAHPHRVSVEKMPIRQQRPLNMRQETVAADSALDNQADERMRRADMLELHRAAMKRMQAVANMHV